MPQTVETILNQALELPVADRVRLLDELTISIHEEAPFHLTDEECAELDRRVQEAERNPDSLVPLEDVLKRIDDRHGRSS